MLVKVRKFLTEQQELGKTPVPLRTMRLVELQCETSKAMYVRLVGTPLPTSECVHCGREISHPVSLHFGIGSTCIKKYHQLLESVDYDDIETSYERLKQSMSKITWEGWLPKSGIETIPESGWEIEFEWGGKLYHTRTYDESRLAHIQQNAKVLSIAEVE